MNGGCDQICTNKHGTFKCSCKRGYRLGSNGKTCRNINECFGQSPCDKTNGFCKDTLGSYQCSCKTGYRLLPDKKSCLGKSVYHIWGIKACIAVSISF